QTDGMAGGVTAVAVSPTHSLSKYSQPEITRGAGQGAVGDAHRGAKVKHRARGQRAPEQPNRVQAPPIDSALHDRPAARGCAGHPGDLGENIAARDVDLLALPTGTRLRIGHEVVVEVTGLRNPCYQIDDFSSGMLKVVLAKDSSGRLVRKAG